jgi:hypothetical protein
MVRIDAQGLAGGCAPGRVVSIPVRKSGNIRSESLVKKARAVPVFDLILKNSYSGDTLKS